MSSWNLRLVLASFAALSLSGCGGSTSPSKRDANPDSLHDVPIVVDQGTGTGGLPGGSNTGGSGGGGSGGSGAMPGGDVTHGDQLTINHVGPWALQGVPKGSEVLSVVPASQLTYPNNKVSTYPGDTMPPWIIQTPYVYNNDPSNHGGKVPSGGLVIDGYTVPGGTLVVQFRDLSAGTVVYQGDNSGSSPALPGLMFRGCRMRGSWGGEGWINPNGYSPGGKQWFNYCDAGAVSDTLGKDVGSTFRSMSGYGNAARGDNGYYIRNYFSLTATILFMHMSGDAAIENYCEKVTSFGRASGYYHLNGLANSGGQTATLWLRNHLILSQQPGRDQLTDVIQMAADDGSYPGTGHCTIAELVSETGYTIRDNYLAGAQFTLQLGQDKSNSSQASVQNIRVIGNKFSTQLYSQSGSAGLGYKGPQNWDAQNCTWTKNTWADGPNAGQQTPSSAVMPGP